MKPFFATRPGISRRRFLSYLTLSSAGLMGIPGLSLAAAKNMTADNVDEFSFADRDGLGPQVDAPTVQNAFFALHDEQRINREIFTPEELQTIRSVLKSEFEFAQIPWDDSCDLSYSYQHFGVPYNADDGHRLLEYCKRVHDYLYSRVNGLFDAEMTWHILTPESHPDDLIDSEQFRADIGRYTYYVMRVFIDRHDMNDLPSLINAQPLNRAIHFIVGDEQSLPQKAHLYLIPGTTSLVSPFSEILHLTFHAPSEIYEANLKQSVSSEKAHEYAIDAGETINEATAIVLAREYIRRYGDSKRVATINAMADNLGGRFSAIHKAIAFISQTGVQKAIDLYLDNPAGFMKQLDKVS
ncbi:MAG: hypothetical protein PVG89_17465 [Gammaproteobacteria bacterium]|jgi:hypothetical protein